MTAVGISGGIGRAAHDFPSRRLATYSPAASICCGSYRRVTLLISGKYSADPHLARVGAPAIARTAFSRAGWTMNRAGISVNPIDEGRRRKPREHGRSWRLL